MIEFLTWIILFIIGYVLIFLAADLFIDNLKDICIIYKVSPFIIGLLVLGIDPEESIASIVAALNGLPYIAIGNVIGNSIISLTLCFALPALFYKIDLKSVSQFYFSILYSCMVAIVLAFFFSFGLFIFGIIAIIIYIIFLSISIKSLTKEGSIDIIEVDDIIKDITEDAEELQESMKKRKILLVCISLSIIILGGEMLIISAENLIELTGLPEPIFGFIIIALVTNVEEITLVVKSIKKQSIEIGLGAMVGKVIWNLSLTFGISGIITMNIDYANILLLNWLILLVLIALFNFLSKRKTLDWRIGIFLMITFVVFIILNIIGT